MQLTILGNNSALPSHNRFPTAQALHVGQELILIDCGEGTQMRLRNNHIKYSRINKIFISHLHGDHYFGLIGLLSSYVLYRRTEPLDLYAPAPLMDIIRMQFAAAGAEPTYEIRFHAINDIKEAEVICREPHLTVTAFPTDHRIACYGFRFEEHYEDKKLLIDEVHKFNIPIEFYASIKKGADYTLPNGKVVANHLLTEDKNSRSVYVFAADSRYTESFIDVIRDVDVLYHETTYLQNNQELAKERYHSTTKDAATLALKAGVKTLIIGHFSSKYTQEQLGDFLNETKAIFPNTLLSAEGMKINI